MMTESGIRISEEQQVKSGLEFFRKRNHDPVRVSEASEDFRPDDQRGAFGDTPVVRDGEPGRVDSAYHMVNGHSGNDKL
jgi:hypothetical protein